MDNNRNVLPKNNRRSQPTKQHRIHTVRLPKHPRLSSLLPSLNIRNIIVPTKAEIINTKRPIKSLLTTLPLYCYYNYYVEFICNKTYK